MKGGRGGGGRKGEGVTKKWSTKLTIPNKVPNEVEVTVPRMWLHGQNLSGAASEHRANT